MRGLLARADALAAVLASGLVALAPVSARAQSFDDAAKAFLSNLVRIEAMAKTGDRAGACRLHFDTPAYLGFARQACEMANNLRRECLQPGMAGRDACKPHLSAPVADCSEGGVRRNMLDADIPNCVANFDFVTVNLAPERFVQDNLRMNDADRDAAIAWIRDERARIAASAPAAGAAPAGAPRP